MQSSMALGAKGDVARDVPFSGRRVAAYWFFTAVVTVPAVWAGVTDILRAPPLYEDLLRLGYPGYFAPLLGTWKVLGAVALVVPRFRLLKEWAYAGLFFDYTGAIVSHAAVGDALVGWLPPALSAAALIGSWSLRPLSRRLAETLTGASPYPTR